MSSRAWLCLSRIGDRGGFHFLGWLVGFSVMSSELWIQGSPIIGSGQAALGDGLFFVGVVEFLLFL
jgi:hypothetical protein